MSQDYCEVDFGDASDDADPVQFYDERIVRACKPYPCGECGGAISKGEAHRRMSYRFEGRFWCDRMCVSCQEIAGEFGFHLVGGMLWETFWGEWDNGAHLQGCLNRLQTARAKTLMREQWQKWQDKRAQQRQEAIKRRAVSGLAPIQEK